MNGALLPSVIAGNEHDFNEKANDSDVDEQTGDDSVSWSSREQERPGFVEKGNPEHLATCDSDKSRAPCVRISRSGKMARIMRCVQQSTEEEKIGLQEENIARGTTADPGY